MHGPEIEIEDTSDPPPKPKIEDKLDPRASNDEE